MSLHLSNYKCKADVYEVVVQFVLLGMIQFCSFELNAALFLIQDDFCHLATSYNVLEV